MEKKNKFRWRFYFILGLFTSAFSVLHPSHSFANTSDVFANPGGNAETFTYKSTTTTTTSKSKKGQTYKDDTLKSCGDKICKPFRMIATLTGGASWSKVGESQSFIDDSSLYDYDADTDSQARALWGASIGEELRFYPDWAVQVNIAYYQMSALEGEGVVTQGVDPATYEHYNYEYTVISKQFLLEFKFLGDMAFGFHPYALLGIGASFNSFSDYDAEVNSPFPFSTFTPNFPGNNNVDISYSAGVGVDWDITNYARIGIGYRYAWLGDASSEDGEINTVPISNALKQENLNASQAILQFTFLI